jgi:hypothetical protein
MRAEREFFDVLSSASKFKMDPQKQQDLWKNIEQKMQMIPSKPRISFRPTLLPATAAAVVIFAVLGIYVMTAKHPDPSAASYARIPQGAYQPPTSVEGITIMSDSAIGLEYFPTNPAKVTSQVLSWLQKAKPTTILMPILKRTIVTNAYTGPSTLHFTDEHGHRISVYPAFTMDNPDNVHIETKYFPNVIAYTGGNNTVYLESPPLYAWLMQDQWKAEFQPESYTDADQKAIQTVLSSPWGGIFQGLFPNTPGSIAAQIPRGGLTPLHKASATLPGTCTTQSEPNGNSTRVTFIETWDHGKAYHSWVFVVSTQGRILSHLESGDIAPQDWK